MLLVGVNHVAPCRALASFVGVFERKKAVSHGRLTMQGFPASRQRLPGTADESRASASVLLHSRVQVYDAVFTPGLSRQTNARSPCLGRMSFPFNSGDKPHNTRRPTCLSHPQCQTLPS